MAHFIIHAFVAQSRKESWDIVGYSPAGDKSSALACVCERSSCSEVSSESSSLAAAQRHVLSCPGPEESLCFQFVQSYNPVRDEAVREGAGPEMRGGKAKGLLSWLWDRKTFPLNLNHKATDWASFRTTPCFRAWLHLPPQLSLILIGLSHEWKWWEWWQKVTGCGKLRVIETYFSSFKTKKGKNFEDFLNIYFAKSPMFHI